MHTTRKILFHATIAILLVAITIITTGCASSAQQVSATGTNEDVPPTAFSSGVFYTGQGNITTKGVVSFSASGIGRRTEDAIIDAKQRAVKAVLFDGIPGSSVTHPLVRPDQRKAKSNYFDQFFEEGTYLNFIINNEIVPGSLIRLEGRQYQVHLKLSINYYELKNTLINADIINSLAD